MSKLESGYAIWDQVGRHLISAQSAAGTEVEGARFVVLFRSIPSVFSYPIFRIAKKAIGLLQLFSIFH
jgi:hypothetical protein